MHRFVALASFAAVALTICGLLATVGISPVTLLRRGPPQALAAADELFSFHHKWEVDSRSHKAYTPPTSTLQLGTPVRQAVATAQTDLSKRYGITCLGPWTGTQKTQLLFALDAVNAPGVTLPTRLGSWRVSSTPILGDVTVDKKTGETVISSRAFVETRVATLDGVTGTARSARLHHAVVAAVTAFGRDADLCDQLLHSLFTCRYAVKGAPNYTSITASTTAEGAGRFTTFLPFERLALLTWWYEMPEAFWAMDGLNWAIRRNIGEDHPFYASAPAVSWPDNQVKSYMEFMDNTFQRDCDTMRHLLLHEKTHFFYARELGDRDMKDWRLLGGWIRDPNYGNWIATRTTSFVSAYAARVNPDEDMAETMSEYILHPSLVRTHSPPKYAFFRDRIMHGREYLPVYWPEASFPVLNAQPYTKFPAIVSKIAVDVSGAMGDSKEATITVTLDPGHGWQSPVTGYGRISAPEGSMCGQKELNLAAPDPNHPNVLVGKVHFGRADDPGWWTARQIRFTDGLGVARWIQLDTSSWALYLNNNIQDRENPEFVYGSLKAALDYALHQNDTTSVAATVPGALPRVTVSFEYRSTHGPSKHVPGMARLVRRAANASYPIERWGACDEPSQDGSSMIGSCSLRFLLNDFEGGTYYVPQISFEDSYGRSFVEYFDSFEEDDTTVTVAVPGRAGPDNEAPEVDLATLKVVALAANPAKPDGETKLTVSFAARDNLSGVGYISFRLLDPLGTSHFGEVKHPNSRTPSFVGNAQAWAVYTLDTTLPRGSRPGQWAVEELEVWDKAGNRADLHMVDLVQFEPSAAGRKLQHAQDAKLIEQGY